MSEFSVLPRNRFFETLSGMNVENRGNDKVALLSEIDMSQCLKLRSQAPAGPSDEVKLSYTALVTRAIALTLREHPYANRMTLEWPFFRRVIQLEKIHITVAVERDEPGAEQAVYAGTLRDTDTLRLPELTRELQQLARAGAPYGERWQLLLRIVKTLAPLARALLKAPRLWPGLWVQHRGGSVMVSSPAKYGVDMLVGHWPWPIGSPSAS
jgi:hypothetical protein